MGVLSRKAPPSRILSGNIPDAMAVAMLCNKIGMVPVYDVPRFPRVGKVPRLTHIGCTQFLGSAWATTVVDLTRMFHGILNFSARAEALTGPKPGTRADKSLELLKGRSRMIASATGFVIVLVRRISLIEAVFNDCMLCCLFCFPNMETMAEKIALPAIAPKDQAKPDKTCSL